MNAFSRAWTDAFGSAYLTLEGGTGTVGVLVVALLEDAPAAVQALERFMPTPFKGRVTLCTLEARRAALIQHALTTLEPNAVIAVEPIERIAASGPVLTLESGAFTTQTGAAYSEGGEVAAWRSLLHQEGDLQAPSLAASLAVRAGLPALACGVADLPRALGRVFTALTRRAA